MAGFSDLTVTVTSGTSAAIDIGTATLVGMYIPSVTSVGIKLSQLNPATGLYDVVATPFGTADAVAGADLNMVIAASTVRYYPISPVVTAGIHKFKFVSSASETFQLGFKVRNI